MWLGRWEPWLARLIIVVGHLSPWLCCWFSEWLGLCGGFVMGCLSPQLCGGFLEWLGLCGGFLYVSQIITLSLNQNKKRIYKHSAKKFMILDFISFFSNVNPTCRCSSLPRCGVGLWFLMWVLWFLTWVCDLCFVVVIGWIGGCDVGLVSLWFGF